MLKLIIQVYYIYNLIPRAPLPFQAEDIVLIPYIYSMELEGANDFDLGQLIYTNRVALMAGAGVTIGIVVWLFYPGLGSSVIETVTQTSDKGVFSDLVEAGAPKINILHDLVVGNSLDLILIKINIMPPMGIYHTSDLLHDYWTLYWMISNALEYVTRYHAGGLPLYKELFVEMHLKYTIDMFYIYMNLCIEATAAASWPIAVMISRVPEGQLWADTLSRVGYGFFKWDIEGKLFMLAYGGSSWAQHTVPAIYSLWQQLYTAVRIADFRDEDVITIASLFFEK